MTRQANVTDPNVARERGFLAEARALKDAPLIELQEVRVAEAEQLAKAVADAAAELDDAARTFDQARSRFGAADVAHSLGTTDPKEAMRLFADREVAGAALRVLGRAHEAAKAKLNSLTSRAGKRDVHRDAAESSTNRLASAVLRGASRHIAWNQLNPDPREVVWHRWAEARAIAQYDRNRASPEYRLVGPGTPSDGGAAVQYGPPPVDELVAVFAIRRSTLADRVTRARAELERLTRVAGTTAGERALAAL